MTFFCELAKPLRLNKVNCMEKLKVQLDVDIHVTKSKAE